MKDEEFMNRNRGKMTMKEYDLMFLQLYYYAHMLVSSMRPEMRKFSSGLSQNMLLEYQSALLNNDIIISKLVLYMH